MNLKLPLAIVVASVGLLGLKSVVIGAETQPAYESSIKIPNETGGESGEAANLASLAKIDSTKATSAATTQVPGTVLKVALDNENGNLVYSVEIKTASNEIKDVKIDAGNAKVLNVDTSGEDKNIEQEGETDGDQEEN